MSHFTTIVFNSDSVNEINILTLLLFCRGGGKQQQPHKTIIIGDSNVGKTSILLRFVKNSFDDMSMPTLGAGFKTKEMTYYDVK